MRRKYLTLSLLLFNVTLGAQPLKIGYINIDYVVANSPQFSQANDRVINKFKPQENNLLLLSSDIQLLADRFNKRKDSFSQLEIKTKINKITSLERKLKQQALALKKQLKIENKQELGSIQKLINQVVRDVAKEQNFDLILYREVAYASKRINITSLISQELRQRFE